MFCTNCGAVLPDDAKYCTSCGAPAPVLGDEEVAGSGEGAPVDVDVSAFDEPTKLEDASAPKRRGLRPAAIAAIAIAVVAVLVGGGVLTWHFFFNAPARESTIEPKAPMQRLTIRYRRATGPTPLRLTARIPVPR